jgi:hypothetical protein
VEGLGVREGLESWRTNFQLWCKDASALIEDSQSILAVIYYHAISIYLSGIFDYRFQFNQIVTPTLSQPRIEHHVDMILSKTQVALETTNLGGVLFFFPLRVAGARATCQGEKTMILEMLKEISRRSFVVADAFKTDLEELWQNNELTMK